MIKRNKFDFTFLANELLDQMPEEVFKSEITTFLDPAMGGGQFCHAIENRLRKYGHSDENISQRVFGFESVIMDIRFAVNKYKLVGQYSLVKPTTFLKTETLGMKFDVVIGNPPYQDSSKTEKGGSTLWSAFVKKSIEELVKDDGYVAMITPNAWMGFGKTGKPMKPYQIHTVFTDIADHFPGVGSTFTGWVLQKSDITTETNFPDEDVKLDLRKFDTLPVGRPLKGLTVIDKVMNKGLDLLEPKLEKNIKGSWSSRQEAFIDGCDASLEKSKKYKYEVFHTNSMSYFVSQEPQDYNQPKIIVSVTSPTPRLYTEPMGCARGDLRCYITVNDKSEGESIMSYLNSKLYRFVWRRPGMISWTNLRVPKLKNKIWTDKALYKFFDLTDEEIQMVEEYKL